MNKKKRPKSSEVREEQLRKARDVIEGAKQSPEFQQRHVATLIPASKWNSEYIHLQKKHNRLLQPGYSELSADKIIHLTQITAQDWITDFLCPNPDVALRQNIAADIITQYQVPPEKLNQVVQQVAQKILYLYPDYVREMLSTIEHSLNELSDTIQRNAHYDMKIQYPNLSLDDPSYQNILNQFILLNTQRERKKITHEYIGKSLETLLPHLMSHLNIHKKTTYPHGDNDDYCILGAAGSGKSTITKDLIQDPLQYVKLSTDDYRGVVLTNEPESHDTDQIFIRTQDSAYCIKDLVRNKLQSQMPSRPNLIVDSVSLESWQKILLEDNHSTHSAVACLDDVSIVPSRAYLRALNPTSGPADKGRQVNTTTLLEGHAIASAFLLTSIPYGVKTNLYHTNVERTQAPPIMAAINTTENKHDIEIHDLRSFSKFLGKANVNTEAMRKMDLYYQPEENEYAYKMDSQYRAEQILKLMSATTGPDDLNYDLILMNNNKPYCKITNQNDEIKLDVVDADMLLDVLNSKHPSSEGWMLQSMLIQLHCGSMQAARSTIKEHGRNQVLEQASQALLPEVYQKQRPTPVTVSAKQNRNIKCIADPKPFKPPARPKL